MVDLQSTASINSKPSGSRNDKTDGLVQSYPRPDVLYPLCPLMYAAVLVDVALAHDRRSVQKRLIQNLLSFGTLVTGTINGPFIDF